MRRPATSQRVHVSKSPEEEISPSYHTIFGIKPVACVQWTHSSRPSLRRSNANPKSHFCARFQSHHSTPRNCSRTARRSYPGSRSLDVPAQGGLLSLRWGHRCRERNTRGKSLSAICRQFDTCSYQLCNCVSFPLVTHCLELQDSRCLGVHVLGTLAQQVTTLGSQNICGGFASREAFLGARVRTESSHSHVAEHNRNANTKTFNEIVSTTNHQICWWNDIVVTTCCVTLYPRQASISSREYGSPCKLASMINAMPSGVTLFEVFLRIALCRSLRVLISVLWKPSLVATIFAASMPSTTLLLKTVWEE